MAVLPITKIGHPVLRTKTKTVSLEQLKSREFQKFIDDMVDTMRAAEGVGLAANQVGAPWLVFVLECRDDSRYPEKDSIPLEVYVNPRVLSMSFKKGKDWEGCLSIPGYRGEVPRAESLKMEAWTREGAKIVRTFRGFHARIVQHEMDHLHGFFYIDRMKGLKTLMHLDELAEQLDVQIQEGGKKYGKKKT